MTSDIYGHLLKVMLTFHNGFRQTHPEVLSQVPLSQDYTSHELQSLLQKGLDLSHHLGLHHSFEEATLFPLLAPKIPSFARNAAHEKEHVKMHIALDAFEEYCKETMSRLQSGSQEVSLHMTERRPWEKDHYDSNRLLQLSEDLGSTLYPHLESEEKSLEAENIRAAGFTEMELRMFPF